MHTLVVTRGYQGPTVLELERSGLFDGSTRHAEVAWRNSREELGTLQRYPDVQCVLHVEDMTVMQRSANSLGISPALDETTIREGFVALTDKSVSDWRRFTSSVGVTPARGVLVRLASDTIRKGQNPSNLRKVIQHCVFRGVNAVDADVLLGLVKL
jgi:hypothetical protein